MLKPIAPTRPELSTEIEISPAFHDLDPMNIVWHGHYIKYLELARCALLARFDYDYPQMHASGYVWPIVDLKLKYVRPARFGQKLRIRVEIVEWEFRLKMNYLILDAETGAKINQASTIQVAVAVDSQEMQYQSPPILAQRLGVTP